MTREAIKILLKWAQIADENQQKLMARRLAEIMKDTKPTYHITKQGMLMIISAVNKTILKIK